MTPVSGTEDTIAIPSDSLSAKPPARLVPGDLVDRYSVIELLGAGGMAEVYRARDARLGRDVALKLVRAVKNEGTMCGSLCSLLMREARTLAQLSHPGLVGVLDVGEHGGCVYLAMELVEGSTLRNWSTGPHDWRERVRVIVDVGRALASAHGANVVHRDVKPDNVLIGPGGRVVVTDFGLARSLADLDETGYACGCAGGATVQVQLDGMVVGTPRYMSPEQLEGRAADGRSDQFSFAVTGWELLFGTLPFRGHDVATFHEAIVAQRFEPPPASTAVPPAISAALQRGMRASPSARYPNMASFVDRLVLAAG